MMTSRALLVFAMLTVASSASAQDASRQIRFNVDARQWQGFIERLTPDSLYLRVRGTDSIGAFSRSAISSVERERVSHPGAAAGIGCLAIGAPLGALGYFGTHDPDSPGIEKVAGVLGFGVGCVVGALGGFLLETVSSHGWEPWPLPNSP